jgi:CrcB protein
VVLNALFPEIPPGTWLANMLEGYLICVAIAFFNQHSAVDLERRLLVTMGLP